MTDADNYKEINKKDKQLLDEIEKETIVHHSDYKDLKKELFHVGAIVVLAVIAIIGLRYLLASSSPTAKAKAVILACVLIAIFVFVTLYFNGMVPEILEKFRNMV